MSGGVGECRQASASVGKHLLYRLVDAASLPTLADTLPTLADAPKVILIFSIFRMDIFWDQEAPILGWTSGWESNPDFHKKYILRCLRAREIAFAAREIAFEHL